MKVDPRELRALVRRDPKLGRVLKLVPPLPDFPREGEEQGMTHFASLARAITFQQLAGKAAAAIWKRACSLGVQGRFPTPDRLLEFRMDELRKVGLSKNKALAIRDLAQHVVDGRVRLRSIGRRSDQEVIEELVAVRGIGEWTAQMFLMFKLGRLDVMAPADLGIQEGLRMLDDLPERPKPKELVIRSECWAPLRSVASWSMWRLLELKAARESV